MFNPSRIAVITALVDNYYYGTLMNSIMDVAANNNARLFVLNTYMLYGFGNTQNETNTYFSLAKNWIDGWIVLPNGASKSYIQKLSETGKPIVSIGHDYQYENCYSVKDDSFLSMENAVEHLINHGHRDIAFVYWSGGVDMVERYRGYCSALKKHNLEYNPKLVCDVVKTTQYHAAQAIDQIINSGCAFTAVAVTNDVMAEGVIIGLSNHKKVVPDDVAVIGYDDTAVCKTMSPPLTSVRQEIDTIGRQAALNLLKLIHQKEIEFKNAFVKSTLITRRSCGCVEDHNPDVENEIDYKLGYESNKYLQEIIAKHEVFSVKLTKTDAEKIKDIMLDIPDQYIKKCIGFWDFIGLEPVELIVNGFMDNTQFAPSFKDIRCNVAGFPPALFLEDLDQLDSNKVVFLSIIRIERREWGVLCYIGELNKYSNLFEVETTPYLYDLLAFALDKDAMFKSTQMEKMDALERIVSGIAHEINTPIGVGVSATSLMINELKKFLVLYENGSIKRSNLEDMLHLTYEASVMVLESLKKTTELVTSFKMVAVNQWIDTKRLFSVRENIEQALFLLVTAQKNVNYHFQIDCDQDLVIYSYPGALSKIITNLVQNSFLHAFENSGEGNIRIEARQDNDQFVLTYTDDGKGIEKEVIKQIYEPFFTTNRAEGGTGLGLNVIHNIVTQTLNGSISCKSEPREGVQFEIVFSVKEPVT